MNAVILGFVYYLTWSGVCVLARSLTYAPTRNVKSAGGTNQLEGCEVKETTSKEQTKVLLCDCKHPAQDKLHGAGKRVHNLANKSGKWRCTVCKNEKE